MYLCPVLGVRGAEILTLCESRSNLNSGLKRMFTSKTDYKDYCDMIRSRDCVCVGCGERYGLKVFKFGSKLRDRDAALVCESCRRDYLAKKIRFVYKNFKMSTRRLHETTLNQGE